MRLPRSRGRAQGAGAESAEQRLRVSELYYFGDVLGQYGVCDVRDKFGIAQLTTTGF